MIPYYGKNKNLESNAVKSIVNVAVQNMKDHSSEYKTKPGFSVLYGYLSDENSSISFDANFFNELKKLYGEKKAETEQETKELNTKKDVAALAMPVANLQSLTATKLKDLALRLDSWNRVVSLLHDNKVIDIVGTVNIQNKSHMLKKTEDVEFLFELPGNACSVLIGLHRLLAAVNYCLEKNLDIENYKLTKENVNDNFSTVIEDLESTIATKVA